MFCVCEPNSKTNNPFTEKEKEREIGKKLTLQKEKEKKNVQKTRKTSEYLNVNDIWYSFKICIYSLNLTQYFFLFLIFRPEFWSPIPAKQHEQIKLVLGAAFFALFNEHLSITVNANYSKTTRSTTKTINSKAKKQKLHVKKLKILFSKQTQSMWLLSFVFWMNKCVQYVHVQLVWFVHSFGFLPLSAIIIAIIRYKNYQFFVSSTDDASKIAQKLCAAKLQPTKKKSQCKNWCRHSLIHRTHSNESHNFHFAW